MRWIGAAVVCVLAAATPARADDWHARRAPFDPDVVRRYEAVLARDPHDASALAHLVDLYRRYRTLDQLEAEYRAHLATGDDWATLVVLARLPRAARADSAALWKRAVAANPNDARGWLALGDAATGDAADARDAYAHAAKLFTASRDRRVALDKLVAAARAAGDAPAIDAAFAELVVLAPSDGALWLDRGTAQLAAKQPAAALASFQRAESLLATDPERRLLAMTSQGRALEASQRVDDAIAQYVKTLDHTPADYSLAGDLVQLVVDADRKRGRLPAAIARLEQRWPDRARGYYEWVTLGDLYREHHDDERALGAYRKAVAKAPTEVGTQRKLIALLDQLHPSEALAQHEAAARLAPGDADLQLGLAKRYRDAQPAKALATLAALSRRMSRNVNAREAIADLYERWDELPLAIGEYEAIERLEPDDPEHAVVLGDARWRAGDPDAATKAWQRLDAIGTADALYRHGEVLRMHERWADAVEAYTRAIALAPTNDNTWYGRARANEELGQLMAALDDARRAVAAVGLASDIDGKRDRALLVHLLAKDEPLALHDEVARWRFALDRGDVASGYLLAAHHANIGSYQLHDVLVELYRLVPRDDSLGIALAHSYVRRGEFDRARGELAAIARRSPARAKDLAKLLDEVDDDEVRIERELRWQEEGRTPDGSLADGPDLVARERFGARLELGDDVHGGPGALLGFGLYRTWRHSPGLAWFARLDWTKRTDAQEEPDAVGVAGGVMLGLVDARK
ncbi:MAG TPA: tetratricopeptide repeat protein, partial [Kofleriaceae bacterium]|nr:tetratricopeptide repeat protein [Kofleriaceae bacterium]